MTDWSVSKEALSREEQEKGLQALRQLQAITKDNADIGAVIAAAANHASIEQKLATLTSHPAVCYLLTLNTRQRTIDGKAVTSLEVPYLEARSVSAKGVEAGTVFSRQGRKMSDSEKLWSEQ